MSDPNRALDETIEESFPASDAPANTVETGTRVGEVPAAPPVVDNREAHQFELTVDGHTAILAYERRDRSLALLHTEVPDALRGRHIGDALVRAALDAARAEHLKIVPICPFVQAYLKKHPQA